MKSDAAMRDETKPDSIRLVRNRSIIAVALALALAGCGRHAVRPSEKEFLADRVMLFDADGQETAADQHVQQNREGAAGGRGTGGGGCGCN